jgi:transposase
VSFADAASDLFLDGSVLVDDDEHVESILRRAPALCGEVLPGVSRRRIWSTEEKLRILAQSTAPGSSPSLTCRMHGISSGQFYTWRRQFRSGELTGFVPVSAAPEPPSLPAPPPPEPPTAVPIASLVEVELPSGVKLRVTGDVDTGTLRRILSALR